VAAVPLINWRETGSIKTQCNCGTNLFHCAVLVSYDTFIQGRM